MILNTYDISRKNVDANKQKVSNKYKLEIKRHKKYKRLLEIKYFHLIKLDIFHVS